MKRSIRWAVGIAIIVGVSGGLGTSSIAQDPYEYWRREMANFSRALGDPRVNERVRGIWLQLVRATGRTYPVLPAQQFTAGQALPNGVVLLDLSIAGNPDVEVTAFWLGHEYGHQVLGHPQLLLTPVGQWFAAASGTSQEDAADRWSARFLRRFDYALEPVLDFLCRMPGGGPGDNHSSGPVRAANVAHSYGRGDLDPCDVRPASRGDDSCVYANDGECDEPDICDPGTDSSDCGRGRRDPDRPRFVDRPPPPPPPRAAHFCCTPYGRFGPAYGSGAPVGTPCYWNLPGGTAYGQACH